MPIEAGSGRLAARRTLRLGLGAGGTFVIAMVLGWPMSFVGAVFAAMFLQAPGPLPVRAAVGLVTVAGLLMIASLFGMQVLLAYPLLFLIALTAALYATFYAAAKGSSPLLIVLLLIALLLLPNIIVSSPELAGVVAFWLPANILIGLLASWMIFAIIPPDPVPAPAGPSTQKDDVQNADAHAMAQRMTLVTAPFAIVFYSFGLSSVLTLVFVAMLAQQLSAASGSAAARGILAANVMGGVIAILVYELIVIAPNPLFMGVLVMSTTLAIAHTANSGGVLAPLAGSALTTVLVLLGGAMAPFGDDVDAKFGDRLMQILAAALYVVAAYHVIEAFRPSGEPATAKPSG